MKNVQNFNIGSINTFNFIHLYIINIIYSFHKIQLYNNKYSIILNMY